MYTLGYAFKPWTEAKAIADGPSILNYIRETARENGIDRHIRYDTHVEAASWSTTDARWTVKARGHDGEAIDLTCNFLFMCAGYYNYARGHAPALAGADRFHGPLTHPQFCPADPGSPAQHHVLIRPGVPPVT